MRIAFFSTKPYDQKSFLHENQKFAFDIVFYEFTLNETTVNLCQGFEVVCVFVNDQVNERVLEELKKLGVKLIVLRCAGFNNVNIARAKELGIEVARVPAYSPNAVAEHTVALMLTLNRKIHKAYNRIKEHNFAIDGLMGFDLHGKTVGIVGLGKIGRITAQILKAFGCKVLAYDPYVTEEADLQIVGLDEIISSSDIISLHCPLTKDSYHLINKERINQMKQGVMLINTSRGALINTRDVIDGLKAGQIGYLGLDVYEEEAEVFFEDLSSGILKDDLLAWLLTFPNVLITSHQAFFTQEAMHEIAVTTLQNVKAYKNHEYLVNQVCLA